MAVSENMAREWANANGCEFLLTSAKNNCNVDAAFDSIVRQFLDAPDHLKPKRPPVVKLPTGPATKIESKTGGVCC